jgi:thiol-disulfide isomerase/thioredoxin
MTTRTPFASLSILALAAAPAALAASPAAPATSPPAVTAEVTCQPDYDFCIEVDGAFPAEARFYRAETRGKFFIDIPDMKSGYLMDLKAKKMTAVPRDHFTRREDALIYRDGLPADAPVYAFSLDGPIIRFEVDRRKVRILRVLDRPALVGEVPVDKLLADRAEYRAAMRAYSPDETSMRTVRSFDRPIRVDIYFGTWCPHCKVYMPKILRVASEANKSAVVFNPIGVPKNFGTEEGPWTGKKIQTIPAVIVSRDGKEITRLSTHENALPEVELAGILQALP